MTNTALAIIMTATMLPPLHASAIPPDVPPGEDIADMPVQPYVPGDAAPATSRPPSSSYRAAEPSVVIAIGLRTRILDNGIGTMSGLGSHLLQRQAGRSAVGALGFSGDLALGPPISLMRRDAGFDSLDRVRTGHWLDGVGDSRVVTVGYAWRDVTVEGSAFGARPDDSVPPLPGEQLKLGSRSTRLSYRPLPRLSLQVSRGTLSGLDQVVPQGDVRRTTLSATYKREFTGGEWQTSLAWGRNSRKLHVDTTGYLAETTVRFAGSHTAFGRLEQVGSDDLHNENPALRRELAKLSKLTIGYYRDLHHRGPARFGIGALASRHFLPGSYASTHGSDPISYMLFMRLSLQ